PIPQLVNVNSDTARNAELRRRRLNIRGSIRLAIGICPWFGTGWESQGEQPPSLWRETRDKRAITASPEIDLNSLTAYRRVPELPGKEEQSRAENPLTETPSAGGIYLRLSENVQIQCRRVTKVNTVEAYLQCCRRSAP